MLANDNAFLQAVRGLCAKNQEPGLVKYFYSPDISGPSGDLPINAIQIGIPQNVAARMLELRDTVCGLEEMPNSFSLSFKIEELGVSYVFLDRSDAVAAVESTARPPSDTSHEPIVEMGEVIFSKSEGVWVQFLTEGPSVAQVHLPRPILESLQERLPQRHRMK